MAFIKLKYCLILGCITFYITSFAQISEENIHSYLSKLYNQRIELVDSLISEKLFMPARNVLNDPFLYSYFLNNKKIYNSKLRIIDSLSTKQSSDIQYKEYLYFASQAKTDGNLVAAMEWYKKCTVNRFFKDEAQLEIEKIQAMFRADTIYSKFGYGLPSQLGYLPTINFRAQRISPTDTSKLYLVKDTTLFSGVLVYKTPIYSSWQGSYLGYDLIYHKYSEGMNIGLRNEEYRLPSWISGLININRYYIPKESQHYLYSNKFTIEDTVYTYLYHENNELLNHNKSFYTRGYSITKSETYDSNGNLIGWSDSENKNGDLKYCRLSFNDLGDTIYRETWNGTDSINESLKLRLNEALDTIEFVQIRNNLKTGMEYQLIERGNNSHSLKIQWENDTILGINGSNLIFVNKNGELLTKVEFIQEANNKAENSWDKLLDGYSDNNENQKYLILYLFDVNVFKIRSKKSTKDVYKIINNKKKIINRWLKQNKS